MPKPTSRPVRGATLNAESRRFNLPQVAADGDWLDEREAIDGVPPRLRTTVTVERPKTIISRNTSPDVPFDRSINPYRGCEHGPRVLNGHRSVAGVPHFAASARRTIAAAV